jgi:NADH:ubiquinone oxidoreductase subunit 6 (subunit J)
MNARRILESAEFIPEGVLGQGKRLANKDALLVKLKRYRQFVTLTLILLYVLAVSVAVITIVMAMNAASPLPKAFLPYVGGAAFVALLEFARRLTKDWLLMTLPLVAAEHVSDEQFGAFVENILTVIGKGEDR